MKTPKFTDAHRFSTPYANSKSTDVRKTFNRIRKQLKEAAELQQAADQEAQVKVRRLK